jgi:hypothetical protein
MAVLFGIAVDVNGNVWASASTTTANASIIVWLGGAMPAHVIPNAHPGNGGGGIEFDNQGTMLVLDASDAAIYTYKCRASHLACKELGRWPLKYETFFGKLDRANSRFEAANGGSGAVDVYAYPGFFYEYSYDNSLASQLDVVGIAALPN